MSINDSIKALNDFIQNKDINDMTEDGIIIFLNILNVLFLQTEEQQEAINFSDLMEFDDLYIFSQIAISKFCNKFNELPILKYESKEELVKYSDQWQKILNYLDESFQETVSIILYDEIRIALNMKYPVKFEFDLESTNNWTSLYNKLKNKLSTEVN